ncbi:Aste57867_11783 [Aphanomyces stellatus]|uniref:Aste57867_11783 protein n=1 Tax=Aphanomyces stellatus TaxID=120398 RepID=A0A485KUD1_9STRA|nr:hypothetical protein As57867_011738 [Aphanomyces stellatus]VFT88639.1 Aste57867_11783 [Aphanomyces stellatus]
MHRYSTEKVLAKALYGDVLLCTDRVTGDSVAIKRMDVKAAAAHTVPSSGTTPRYVEEDIAFEKHVNRMLSAKGGHPNIVRMRADFIDAGFDHFVFDYCGGGELFDVLCATAALSPVVVHRYTLQIFSAVQFMHTHGVAHRDLSLENVLLDATHETCYVCDFGLAASATDGAPRHEVVGKPFYMAPEVVAGEAYAPTRADVWSLGIMLFMMLSGAPLFEVASDKDSRFRYLASHGLPKLVDSWQLGHRFDAASLDLLSHMLAIDPKKRPTMDEVVLHRYVVGDACKWPSSRFQSLPKSKREAYVAAAVGVKVSSVSLGQAFVSFFSRRKDQTTKCVDVSVASI